VGFIAQSKKADEKDDTRGGSKGDSNTATGAVTKITNTHFTNTHFTNGRKAPTGTYQQRPIHQQQVTGWMGCGMSGQRWQLNIPLLQFAHAVLLWSEGDRAADVKWSKGILA
jgi:hypothetical protein